MRKKIFQICEYGKIAIKPNGVQVQNSLSEIFIDKGIFDQFYDAVTEFQNESKDGLKAFRILTKKGEHQIVVRDYVGVIETSKGYQLEILPKIHLNKDLDELNETKRIFFNMLKRLKNSPFINLNEASIRSHTNFPILEVFVGAFIDELIKLIRTGLKSDYLDIEENQNTLKGKILIPQNIRLNHSNRARFYCRYNVFSEDNSANRLLKSTLLKLKGISRNYKNLDRIQSLLVHLDMVNPSSNFMSDFENVSSKGRNFKKYDKILGWSRVFLQNSSFTNSAGDTRNLSILFPMWRVFEDYIGYLFKKYSYGRRIKLHDQSYFLVDRHKSSGKFRLEPDIVSVKQDVHDFVMDTKWKLINQYAERKNYEIAQSDMYQLYAYGRKYSNESSPLLVLIYPRNQNFTDPIEPFNYEGDLNLMVFPFDLRGNEVDHAGQVERILSLRLES